MNKAIKELSPSEIRQEIAGIKGYLWGDNIPNWTEDISVAWELVVEIGSPHLQINYYPKPKREPGPLYTVRFNMMILDEARAATAPLAICKAYLTWKRVQVGL